MTPRSNSGALRRRGLAARRSRSWSSSRGDPDRGDGSFIQMLCDVQPAEQGCRVPGAVVPGGSRRRGAQRHEPVDVRDSGRSDQVFHADGSYLVEGGVPQCDRPDRGPIEVAPAPLTARGWRAISRSTATPGSREAGVAFGAPVAMIRHRFGGNLRAARAEASRRRSPCTVARSPYPSGVRVAPGAMRDGSQGKRTPNRSRGTGGSGDRPRSSGDPGDHL